MPTTASSRFGFMEGRCPETVWQLAQTSSPLFLQDCEQIVGKQEVIRLFLSMDHGVWQIVPQDHLWLCTEGTHSIFTDRVECPLPLSMRCDCLGKCNIRIGERQLSRLHSFRCLCLPRGRIVRPSSVGGQRQGTVCHHATSNLVRSTPCLSANMLPRS